MCQLYCCSACENNYNTCESFDAHNNDTIKPIEAKTIDLPIVVEAIEAKTSYKHCIDNIGASISLVYAKNWQNILHIFVKL
jgi:hypothetical protein